MINVEIFVDCKLLFFTGKEDSIKAVKISFDRKRSIKDLLESIGIPHVEIGCVFLDGAPIGLNALVEYSCRLDVRSVEPVQTVNEEVSPQFILDVHLGRLAVNLRMLGFEADYSSDRDDAELSELAAGADGAVTGILLSCDRGLLMRKVISDGMVIRSRNPVEQAAEVVRRYGLARRVKPFSRCLNCSGMLEPAGGFAGLTEDERLVIPARVRGWCDEYTRCSRCGQIYWKGTHIEKMREKIESILALAEK